MNRYHLHRYVGLGAACFLVFLAVSGWLMHHADRFGLSERYVCMDSLLDWYGIEAPSDLVGYRVAGHTIVTLGGQIYFDGRWVGEAPMAPVGAVPMAPGIIVAFPDQLLWFDDAGRIIERIEAVHGVPRPVTRIGLLGNGHLAAASAQQIFVADGDLLVWARAPDASVSWSDPVTLEVEQQAAIRASYRERVLTWQRVIADAHSGRILGWWGPWLMDLVALALLLLAVSGLLIWSRRRG
ncbi:MAG: PepSY domain-containing protein [Pseudomonadota bacterium]|nr:PepSY domain-containing protein [Pseudomonadota bacterium]